MFSKIQSVIIILILLFYTSPLHAFSICPHKWFILPGLGLSIFNGTFMTGGEISATFSKDCVWYGIYGDIYTDFDQVYKKSIGLELGAGPFGLDIGFLSYENQDHTQYGFRVRPILSFTYVAIYMGAGAYFDTQNSFLDTGILFKLPICQSKVYLYKLIECY
jgi:hypothetical protein